MSQSPFIFIKVFSEISHAEDFIRGNLHLKRLSYFQNLEESNDSTRGDKFEGVVNYRQPDQVKLTITQGENTFEIEQLASPFVVKHNALGFLHVFCLYSAHEGNLVRTEEDEHGFKKGELEIPKELAEFGKYPVIVLQPNEFIKRVMRSCHSRNLKYGYGHVEYYDPESFSGEFQVNQAAFKKQNKFEYQSEYRFAVSTETIGEEPINLSIGSIEDIAHMLHIGDIKGSMRIEVNRNESEEEAASG